MTRQCENSVMRPVLAEFTYAIGADFAEYYKKQPERRMRTRTTIDLTQMLEDNVVMNLPTKRLP